MLADDDAEGAIAVAEEQSHGRVGLDEAGMRLRGRACSYRILLRPRVDPARLPALSLVAGGAVADAIAEVTGIEPAIKYPNDILIGSRKVAGILAE
jgi:BirA family biotin operon repressor/biotin-[acetyl-CoA-carboxylase] ligase